MKQDMRVVKHQTVEAEIGTTYKVHFNFASTENTNPFTARKLTLESNDSALLCNFPMNEIICLAITKPQKKLVTQ